MEQKIYMCKPTYFDVKYSINTWMCIKNKPDLNIAKNQWNILYKSLKKLGAKIDIIDLPNLPDSVFVADAGIIINNNFVLSNFRFKERKKEIPYWKNYFIEKYNIIDISEYGYFEGSGDSFVTNDYFICGHGYRSSEKASHKISELLNLKPITLKLINEKFYHLDTCFSLLNNETILFYPKALCRNSISKIENNFNCFALTENEVLKFACNNIILENKIILHRGCYNTAKLVEKLGFEVIFVDLDEFMKAGGGAKCLTLKSININNFR